MRRIWHSAIAVLSLAAYGHVLATSPNDPGAAVPSDKPTADAVISAKVEKRFSDELERVRHVAEGGDFHEHRLDRAVTFLATTSGCRAEGISESLGNLLVDRTLLMRDVEQWDRWLSKASAVSSATRVRKSKASTDKDDRLPKEVKPGPP